MKIKLYPPFDRLAQAELSLPLKHEQNVADVLNAITSQYPDLKEYINVDGDTYKPDIVILRAGRAVAPKESVCDTDVLDVFLPIMGG